MRVHCSLITFAVLCGSTGLSAARAGRMSYLDNGLIRIGVDLDTGGTISFLARCGGGENLINSHDLGRQIQQSYYSGPNPFGKPHPAWKNWGWNPIGSGDAYNHPARVVAHSNDARTLYVRTIPMQWALDNVPGDCTFESWIVLEGNIARVRNRLVNERPDKTQYAAHSQELPAVYTTGRFHRLFTYTGSHPFKGQSVSQIHNAGPPWTSWKATENWAALVNDQGWGLGVIHPGVFSFTGGFHGKPNSGGPEDDPTGYVAPLRREILDHNIVYEYQYLLVLGALGEIRACALANRIEDTRPDYHFRRDRQHWIYHNASDTGFPIDGSLHVRPGATEPAILGPEQWWRAEQVPVLFIRAAFRTRRRRAAVSWSVAEGRVTGARRVEFAIEPDGEFHTYRVDLTRAPGYRGSITGLQLELPPADRQGDEARIAFISWKGE